MAPAALLTRKHLAWQTWLDLPVGLTLPARGTTGVIHLRRPGLAYDGPYQPGVTPGWLVLIGIRNCARTSVCGSDFTAPPTFSFPGRQVTAARISREPAARTARSPEIRLLTPDSPQPGAGDRGTDRVQLTGDFLLRPGDDCALAVVLTGKPAEHRPPVQHDGALRAGKITSEPGPSWF